jgi:lysophospholipase L1-like esterase
MSETLLIQKIRLAISEINVALAEYANNASILPQPTKLVLFGDSRLNGDWNVLLNRNDILNLSVAGSKATDWKAKWQENVQKVKDSGAKKVIIQYGKNEVDAGMSPAAIAHEIQDIVTLIGVYAPGVRVGVLGTLPVSIDSQNADYINTQINSLQSAILSSINATNPKGIWYQGFQSLVQNEAIKQEYTDDGSHLNNAGKTVYKKSILDLEALIP